MLINITGKADNQSGKLKDQQKPVTRRVKISKEFLKYVRNK